MAGPMEREAHVAAQLAEGARPADEQYRLLVESLTDAAICLLDVTGRVVSWNTGAERIQGYAAREIVGRHFSLFYPVEERAEGRAEAALQRAEREGRYEEQGWRLRKDGTRFWADAALSTLRGPLGEPRGFASVTRDLTASRRERENEVLLAAMFEHTPAGIVMADATGRFLHANPTFLRLLGYGAEELAGKSIDELTHPDDADLTWRIFEDLVQGRRNQAEFEKRYLRKNGQAIWVRLTVARLPDAGGRLRCLMAMVEDITERQLAFAALRESEALLQAFTNHSPAAMFLKDREGRYRFVNQQFLQRMGLTRAQVIGQRDEELFTPQRAQAAAAHDAEILVRGQPLQFEESAHELSGERSSMVTKFPVFDGDGAVLGVGGVATDITERKRAEQALREQGTLLAEAQKLAGLGCWEWDPGSGRVTWSDELYRIYGLERGAFQPSFESYLERVHPEDRHTVAATLSDALVHGRPFTLEERIRRPDGELRHLRTHGEAMRERPGAAPKMVGTCLDVTDQKAAEAALRALSRRLVEAEEAERRRIARELHDRVGQNLSALNINLDIVLGRLQDPALRRRLDDSLALVDATLQSIENVMADLRPALLDEYGLSAALAWYAEEYVQRTGIPVTVDAFDGAKRLAADTAVALFRIAQEALTNAAKHSSAKRIAVRLESGDGEVALSVSDDGCGFDAAQAPRGRWGMTTMRERAQAAGGRLAVQSSPGRGTTVRAAVPLSP
jgi:PAS domain S-box-containing protein